MRPRKGSLEHSRPLGIASIVAEGFGHGWKVFRFRQNGQTRSSASHVQPKAGFCTSPAQSSTEAGQAPTPGAERGRPAGRPPPRGTERHSRWERRGKTPRDVANVWGRNRDTRLLGKERQKRREKFYSSLGGVWLPAANGFQPFRPSWADTEGFYAK